MEAVAKGVLALRAEGCVRELVHSRTGWPRNADYAQNRHRDDDERVCSRIHEVALGYGDMVEDPLYCARARLFRMNQYLNYRDSPTKVRL